MSARFVKSLMIHPFASLSSTHKDWFNVYLSPVTTDQDLDDTWSCLELNGVS